MLARRHLLQVAGWAYAGRWGGCRIVAYTVSRFCVGQGAADGCEWRFVRWRAGLPRACLPLPCWALHAAGGVSGSLPPDPRAHIPSLPADWRAYVQLWPDNADKCKVRALGVVGGGAAAKRAACTGPPAASCIWLPTCPHTRPTSLRRPLLPRRRSA